MSHVCTRNSHRHARSYSRPEARVRPFALIPLSYHERERRWRPGRKSRDEGGWCALLRARSASPRRSRRRNIYYPVHRPEEEDEEEVEVGIVQGGVRARVVERQIVRHLTHLIPYLTPSTVTTLIHPFLRRAFLQPDPLTLRAISPPPVVPLAVWPTSSLRRRSLPLHLPPSIPLRPFSRRPPPPRKL